MRSVVAETIDIVIEKSHGTLEKISVDDVVIGVFFTGVKLSTGHAGVAFTAVGELPEAVCCPTSAARMPAAWEKHPSWKSSPMPWTATF
jgi:uncharacterized protein